MILVGKFKFHSVNFILNLLFLFVLSNCIKNNKIQYNKINGNAQGTTYSILFYSDNINIYKIKLSIDSLLLTIDNAVSNWNQNSTISKINESNLVEFEIPDSHHYFKDLLQYSEKIYNLTDGYFDPTLYYLINAWGLGVKPKKNIEFTIIDSIFNFIGFDKIKYQIVNEHKLILTKKNPNIKIDFNAIAQGYSVDKISELLDQYNINSYFIELGGEIKVKGTKRNHSKWKIGIDSPYQNKGSRKLQTTVNLSDKSIATSGSYRKFYIKDGKKFAHIINPKTGYPVTHQLLSVTVISDKCWEADAFATAFMAMGKQKTITFLEQNKNSFLGAYLIFLENDTLMTYKTTNIKNIFN